MTSLPRSLCWIALSVCLWSSSATAQAPQMVQRRNNPLQASPPSDLLSANYRLSFSGTSKDKPLGELSALTCATRIELSGPLDSSEAPAEIHASGTLEEKEGAIIFQYQVVFMIHKAPTAPAGAPNLNGPGSHNAASHSVSGTLRMVPGNSYELLRCGGNTYTVKLSLEPDKTK